MQLTKIYAQQLNRKTIDMSLSENPLGCSSRVLKVLKNINAKDINQYPQSQNLINKIALKFQIQPNNVLLGNGSEQLIKLIAQSILKPQDLVFIQRGTFGVFSKECELCEAKIKFINPLSFVLKQNPKLIFLCNPVNPTGKIISLNLIIKIVKQNPKAIVIIDEANGEFLKKSVISQAIILNNCLVLRTFSKVIGLAGVRIGFVVGNIQLINQLAKSQQPFPVSGISLKLAESALNDNIFINRVLKFFATERQFLINELTKRNLKVAKSQTNNLFIQGNKYLVTKLEDLGIGLVRNNFFPGLKTTGFRISIKDKKTNRLFLKKIDEALSCLNSKKLLTLKEKL